MTQPYLQPSFLLRMLVVATLYALLAYVNHLYFESEAIVSIFEPACGFALAVLLLGGRQYAPAIFIGALLAHAMQDDPWWMAVAAASGSMLEALVAAWLLTRCNSFDLRFRSLYSYLLLIFAAGMGGIICTLLESVALLVTPDSGSLISTLAHRWMGEILGISLITPLVLTWHHYRVAKVKLLEPLLLLGLTFFVGLVVFLDTLHDSLGLLAKGYWMFLFVTWVAVRLGVRGVTIALLVTAAQALSGAHQGVGFFAHDIAQTQLANYWFYMITLSIVGMTLAAYFTELKLKEGILLENETKFRNITESAQDAIITATDRGNIVGWNSAAQRLFGYTKAEINGQALTALMPERYRELHAAGFAKMAAGKMPHFMGKTVEFFGLRKDGSEFPIELSLARWHAAEQQFFTAIIRDITANKQTEAEIRNLAFYDSLTRLPNRRLLLDRLKQALACSARNGLEGALLFIDLDNFKSLNDTLGHDIGDLLLQQVARRLESCVREGDTVARLGGDEFVVMLEGLSKHELEAAAQVKTVGAKILNALNQTYQLGMHDHHSTPSIGVTLFSDHKQNRDELLKQADIAMYQAKKAGRNTLRFFDPAMQATVNTRVSLESELRRAVAEQEEFSLYYQVQVDTSGRTIGAEALLRWLQPERDAVSPAKFIPLAEETGLILPLGHWVLATACLQLAAWAQRPETAHLTLAVNVSARQFHLPTFVDEVLTLIDYFRIDPTKLKLEITESMLLDDTDDIIINMSALKNRGVNFSMDDFGTGYSSLQYLKRLPLAQLKIDQSFVRDIDTDDSDKAIVRTIIAMAHSLNLSVIAEGVETEEQRQHLLNKGCTAFQGYLFGRPMPIDEFDAILSGTARAASRQTEHLAHMLAA